MYMKQNQKISVVIPVYNERQNVKDLYTQLVSALLITGLPFEIIFVDDNSTDGTYEYLKKLQGNKGTKIQDKNSVLKNHNADILKVFRKKGNSGKAYSLVEGFKHAEGSILCMIDGDLQYPPSSIPHMVKLLDYADIVVANRKVRQASFIRLIASKIFRFMFGRVLFGLGCDIQSGLKVFKKEVFKVVDPHPVSGWTFDLNFLYIAFLAGYRIKNYDITFSLRKYGFSKVNILKTAFEISINAIRLRIKSKNIIIIPPEENELMINAGLAYKKRRYITHTTLPQKYSAIHTLIFRQKLFIIMLILLITGSILFWPLEAIRNILLILSTIYFLDAAFSLLIVMKSFNERIDISIPDDEIKQLNETTLPVYSILCPLYKEAYILPQFIEAIAKIDWPKEKLDVLLLLEEDDRETIQAIEQIPLPLYIRKIIVPDSQPKTKPKACNYGLSKAIGEYIVIFDAEDIPDPLQLKKVYLAFNKIAKNIVCLQAKLNFYNPNQNILTRFFTAEYSQWFDITLMGLQSLNTSIPLGGTSNHFKKDILLQLKGWDPFNVTEDADLGIRLFKNGYRTAIIESTTYEEANSKIPNWIRQRSRWIKGYMQTYYVHMRDALPFAKKYGIHFWYFQVIIGGKIAFMFINPFLWVTTILYFSYYSFAGPTIEKVYLAPALYLGVVSLVFGNFVFMYSYMLGCAKRSQWDLLRYIFFVPFYWLIISYSALIACYQLIVKPFYWEKTTHGLYLQSQKKRQKVYIPKVQEGIRPIPVPIPIPVTPVPLRPAYSIAKSKDSVKEKRTIISQKRIFNPMSYSFITGQAIQFGIFIYVNRLVSLSDAGKLGLLFGILTLIPTITQSIRLVVHDNIIYFNKRYGEDTAYYFWTFIRSRFLFVAIIISALWLSLLPFFSQYLHIENQPVILFTPVVLLSLIIAVDHGFLSSKQKNYTLSFITLLNPFVTFTVCFLFIKQYTPEHIYTSMSISSLVTFVTGWFIAELNKPVLSEKIIFMHLSYPKKKLILSLLSGLSMMFLFSIDSIIVRHAISDIDTGTYALISAIGKIVLFINTLPAYLLLSPLANTIKKNTDNKSRFKIALLLTITTSVFTFIIFGIGKELSIPLLYGQRSELIISFMLQFMIAVTLLSFANVFIQYYISQQVYSFAVLTLIFSALEIFLINNSNGIGDIINMLLITGFVSVFSTVLLHTHIRVVRSLDSNIRGFFSIFNDSISLQRNGKLQILIFNWRDKKHKQAGGAELYIHEIAKQWTNDGNHITVFCGKDKNSERNEFIDNINYIRRGGRYSVYIYAFIYYILYFKGHFDVIIDSENGIPFFTPLYVKEPVLLLIHHIHKDIFKDQLPFPLHLVASVLETKVMPFVYRNKKVITVSESTRKEFEKLPFSKPELIYVINPGINPEIYSDKKKLEYPALLYLGRLKKYKNIEFLINTFPKILKRYRNVRLTIAGEGELHSDLEQRVRKLNLDNNIKFAGYVSEGVKTQLLGESWMVLQPSKVEGWSISVIEANACGTPVIGMNVNGLRDSIIHNKTGLLFSKNSEDQYLNSVFTLIDNSSMRQDLSRMARQWSLTFSWTKSARELYSLIIDSVPEKRYLPSYPVLLPAEPAIS